MDNLEPAINKRTNKLPVKILKWICVFVFGLVFLTSVTVYFLKDSIGKLVLGEINKELNEPISAKEVDLVFWGSFPNLSVELNHVHIKDKFSLEKHTDTLFFAEKLSLQFNPMDLWHGRYDIKNIDVANGVVKLKTNVQGKSNFDIANASTSKTKSSLELKLKQIGIEKVRLIYFNAATAQFYATHIQKANLSGDFSSDKYTLKAKCEVFISELKSNKIVLLANKKTSFDINLMIDNKQEIARLPNALIDIEGLPFLLNGDITKDSLFFQVKSKNIALADLVNKLSLDDHDEYKQYKGKGKVHFDLQINGAKESSSPMHVDCQFGVTNGSITEPGTKLTASDISLAGSYSNKGGEEQEVLKFERVNFKTAGGPFSGDLIIKNFARPSYEGNAKGNIDLHIVDKIFRIPSVDKIQGRVKVNASFIAQQGSGTDNIQQCNGSIQLANVELKLDNDKRTFNKINGKITLQGSEIGIASAHLSIDRTDLNINGTIRNIFNYLSSKGNLNATVRLESNYVNVADLGTTTKAQKIEGERIFALPENIQGSIDLALGQLNYENHIFNNVSGIMQIDGRQLVFPQITCVSAGTKLTGSLSIQEKTPEIFHLGASIVSKNIQFKPLFKEWNNFQQSVLTDENLSGSAEATLDFSAPFDLRSGILSKGIQSKLALKVFNGHLKNVESFKDIISSLRTKTGRLVLGNNNINEFEKKLNNLSFETMENTIIISDGKIQIPKMTIVSSAMDLDVSGTHSFENIVDYHFAFRLNDIKQSPNQTSFGEIIDDQTGFRVFMRMHGPLDNPQIEWDKAARSEQFKTTLLEEKTTVKSILKSEFGLFKKDSSITTFQAKDEIKEEIKVNFNPKVKTEKPAVIPKEQKPKKEEKIKKNLQHWKEQEEEENENIIVVGKGKGK